MILAAGVIFFSFLCSVRLCIIVQHLVQFNWICTVQLSFQYYSTLFSCLLNCKGCILKGSSNHKSESDSLFMTHAFLCWKRIQKTTKKNCEDINRKGRFSVTIVRTGSLSFMQMIVVVIIRRVILCIPTSSAHQHHFCDAC